MKCLGLFSARADCHVYSPANVEDSSCFCGGCDSELDACLLSGDVMVSESRRTLKLNERVIRYMELFICFFFQRLLHGVQCRRSFLAEYVHLKKKK